MTDENSPDADLGAPPPPLDLSSDLSPNRQDSASLPSFKLEEIVNSSLVHGSLVDLGPNRSGLVLMVVSSMTNLVMGSMVLL